MACVLTNDVQMKLGLLSATGSLRCALESTPESGKPWAIYQLNDHAQLPFSQIADWIEEHQADLFHPVPEDAA